MKHKKLIIGVVVGGFLLGIAASFVVRAFLHVPGVSWGMSQAQLKRYEDAELVEESDTELSYTFIETEFPIAVNYRFFEDRLVEIVRVPGKQYASLETALDDIEILLEKHEQLYGTLSDEIFLPYRVEFLWETPDSMISVVVWYVEEVNSWTWAATSQDATFESYEPADENIGRV